MRYARLNRAQRPLIGILSANAISQFGITFSLIAIPWFVLETTGIASQTGISVAAGVVPFVIVGMLSGSMVERIGYKRASVVSDLLSFASALLIPVLYEGRGLECWQLLLVFIGAFFDSPGISARQAMLPELAQKARVSRERANTSYSLIRRFAILLGPPTAGHHALRARAAAYPAAAARGSARIRSGLTGRPRSQGMDSAPSRGNPSRPNENGGLKARHLASNSLGLGTTVSTPPMAARPSA